MISPAATIKKQRKLALEGKAYKEVLCTKCGARPGEVCTGQDGKAVASTHAVRLRMSAYKPVKP